MNEIRFFELLAKKYASELSLSDHKELLDLAQENPDFAKLLKDVDLLYNTSIYGKSAEEYQTLANTRQILFDKIRVDERDKPIAVKRRISWVRVVLSAAAASLLLFIANYFFNRFASERETKENIVLTKKGSKSNLILPDGSQVWLNADSKISYPSDFSKESRELTLVGEAYFDVIRDPAHPFIIHTEELDIKVLGTSFNVRAYPGEKQTEATLIRGAIEATLNNYEGKKVILKPFEKISVSNIMAVDSKETKAQPADNLFFTLRKIKSLEPDSTTFETQWLKNKLAFNKTKLSEIAEQLERYYGVDITITSDKLKHKEYNGVFHNKELQDVLESLRLAGGFNYSIENKIVTIVP